jgi:hypothetical protein
MGEVIPNESQTVFAFTTRPKKRRLKVMVGSTELSLLFG